MPTQKLLFRTLLLFNLSSFHSYAFVYLLKINFFFNRVENKDHKKTGISTKVIVYSNGTCRWSYPLFIHVMCSIDVSYFPLDLQKCFLMLGSMTYTKHEIIITQPRKRHITPSYKNEEWTIYESSIKTREFWDEKRENSYSVVEISLSMERGSLYFITEMLIPCFLIACLTILGNHPVFNLKRQAKILCYFISKKHPGSTIPSEICVFVCTSKQRNANVSTYISKYKYELIILFLRSFSKETDRVKEKFTIVDSYCLQSFFLLFRFFSATCIRRTNKSLHVDFTCNDILSTTHDENYSITRFPYYITIFLDHDRRNWLYACNNVPHGKFLLSLTLENAGHYEKNYHKLSRKSHASNTKH